MKVMVFIKGDPASEEGVLPDAKFVAAMMAYNEQLVKAGVLLATEGLYPSAKGKRVKFSGSKATVIDGPFTEAKELIAGFWMWQVKSIDEAVEWVKRLPKPEGVEEGEIEIRPIFEMPDFMAEVQDRDANASAQAE